MEKSFSCPPKRMRFSISTIFWRASTSFFALLFFRLRTFGSLKGVTTIWAMCTWGSARLKLDLLEL
jgi:hypothetical protein